MKLAGLSQGTNGARPLVGSRKPALGALVVGLLLLTAATQPAFVTSAPNGGWSTEGYYVHNNLWNSAKYTPCKSTLSAWSAGNWNVVAKMNNQTGDGAVKAYPNVHRDYRRVPINSYESMTSRFAETSAHLGIYNVAYDLWINGIASPGCTEIMVWVENFNQTPAGKFQQEVRLGNRAYRVFKTQDNRYIAFVAGTNFTSGTVDLLEMMNWAMARGWYSNSSTLDQVCFGVELVSTEDKDARFEVTDFSIDAKLKPGPTKPGGSKTP